MEFDNLYNHGFARLAAATTRIWPGQPARNIEEIVDAARDADGNGAAVTVFPELCISGYSLEDLVLQDALLDAVDDALEELAALTSTLRTMVIVGAPLRAFGRVYNCAVAIQGGTVLGVTPKMFLANYGEFYEKRWFAEGARAGGDGLIQVGRDIVPFGRIIYDCLDVPGLSVAAEVCEDLWVPLPPSTEDALAGATVLANLSGSPVTVGRAADRALMTRSQAFRTKSAYIYAASGLGESSSDLAWDGQTMVWEEGDLLAQSQRFPRATTITLADVDLDRLQNGRRHMGSFDDCRAAGSGRDADHLLVEWEYRPDRDQPLPLDRKLDRFPFVPDDPALLDQDCYEAYNIQVSALAQRLEAIGNPKIVIGISGGLDSTQALIVAAHAMDLLGRPRTDILGFTMPGFATSDHTKDNAYKLAGALGISFEELDIRGTATGMLRELGHPAGQGEEVYDVTFENVQAGLRTDFLFRIANQRGGIVLGTGDMSELALGWCTYGVGDHMSHYGVNAGVPKTLIQHVIRWVAGENLFGSDASDTLLSILGTEISPELVPGGQLQSTQAQIGPYELQDFTLFHLLRGYRPTKIAFLAWNAWKDVSEGAFPPGFPEDEKHAYDLPTVTKWLRLFLKRFFNNQFKRTCLPSGPKVVAGGSLSPRGDWRMPADVNAQAWLRELDDLQDMVLPEI
ncbi:MAG: NAD(+) synthase [Actinomycetaceae bacterium]|nr:NAD(+) synthase [Actinomycetaceae bacterium]